MTVFFVFFTKMLATDVDVLLQNFEVAQTFSKGKKLIGQYL